MMFLYCNPYSWNLPDIIQTILALFACITAILIPVKISWEQRYSQLLADYRGYDFGAAVMGLTMFFYQNCKNDVNLIQKEYKQVFDAQFENQLKQNSNKNQYIVSNDQNLHFQRRLLTQFYWDLDQCSRSIFIGKRRIKKDFTSKEANLLKILYYMNDAATSEGIFMDITTDDRISPNAQSINKYIKHMYDLLKATKPYVR